MSVLVCTSGTPDHSDMALRVCRWMATRTSEELKDRGVDVVERFGVDCDRDHVGKALSPEVHGLVGLDHGSDATFGVPPVLDSANAALGRGRFVHLVACNCGRCLVDVLVAGGAEIFVGYDWELTMGGDFERLPLEAKDLMVEVVTATSVALAKGVRDPAALHRRMDALALAVTSWFDEHPEYGAEEEQTYWAAQMLADKLHTRMVVRTGADR